MSDGETNLFAMQLKSRNTQETNKHNTEEESKIEYTAYMAFPFNPFNPWEDSSNLKSKWHEYPDLKASEVILNIKKEMVKNKKLLDFYLKDAKIDKESYIIKLRENPEEIVKEDIELFGYYRKIKDITYSRRIEIGKK